ncbi:hypothetical protein BDY19DRAFT_988256 [Irpex rosettiformis]|uniref:Uncharacterized protein n=1 Tax=Irpex rosettiformis TaxID=378272 RepID=A0ACB8UJ45_9APHY|nr:hypothetical protein BDY19DRAFT_988256 [Irpex rosettiformis]
MSSYYTSQPSSPVTGFFPNGPASPHAFSTFGQSPRDSHNMEERVERLFPSEEVGGQKLNCLGVQ